MTNTEKPIVDERSVTALMDFRDRGNPTLWGEVSPEGVVTWRPEFHIAEIKVGPEFHIERTEVGPGWVYEGHYSGYG